jgi:hypothetical protein
LCVLGALAAALRKVAAAEITAWSPSVVRTLIKFAVRRLPEDQRVRFDEEWQSHVNEVPGQVGKLFVAVGFLIAACNISLDERCNKANERCLLMLVVIDKVTDLETLALKMVQGSEGVVSLEESRLFVNRVKSLTNGLQHERDRLTARIETISVMKPTLIRHIFYKLTERMLFRSMLRKISDLTRENNRLYRVRMTADEMKRKRTGC